MRRRRLFAVGLLVTGLAAMGFDVAAGRFAAADPPPPTARSAGGTGPAGGAGPAAESVPPDRVLLVGDSLTFSAREALAATGLNVESFGGTAPCDWLSQVPAALARVRPAAVLFEFEGNNSTRCMAGVTTAAQLGARYRVDMGSLVDMARRAGARIVFLEPVAVAADRGPQFSLLDAPQIREVECALAASSAGWVRCDSTVRDMLTPASTYRSQLGGELVREGDGVHLTKSGVGLYVAAVLRAATATAAPTGHR